MFSPKILHCTVFLQYSSVLSVLFFCSLPLSIVFSLSPPPPGVEAFRCLVLQGPAQVYSPGEGLIHGQEACDRDREAASGQECADHLHMGPQERWSLHSILFISVLFNYVLFNSIRFYSIHNYAQLYLVVLYYILFFSTAFYSISSYAIIFYCVIWYFLFCSVLFSTILYYYFSTFLEIILVVLSCIPFCSVKFNYFPFYSLLVSCIVLCSILFGCIVFFCFILFCPTLFCSMPFCWMYWCPLRVFSTFKTQLLASLPTRRYVNILPPCSPSYIGFQSMHILIFKMLVPTYRAVHWTAPSYPCELITPYTPSRSRRSAGSFDLDCP